MRYHEIIMEVSSSVPIKTFRKLYHVGTFNVAHKDAGSYEGAGLSVSLHPQEWTQIAKLTGSVWQCTKLDNHFIDFYKLSKMNKAGMEEWAIRGGWAVPKTSWRVTYHDDKTNQTRYRNFYDENQAKAEAKDLNIVPEKIEGTMVSTPRLRMLQYVSGVECLDLIVVAYAEDVMRYDGVWWSEQLNVAALSAPRGVIVPSVMSSWSFTKVG